MLHDIGRQQSTWALMQRMWQWCFNRPQIVSLSEKHTTCTMMMSRRNTEGAISKHTWLCKLHHELRALRQPLAMDALPQVGQRHERVAYTYHTWTCCLHILNSC
jgi:hypothetical protein